MLLAYQTQDILLLRTFSKERAKKKSANTCYLSHAYNIVNQYLNRKTKKQKQITYKY
jgi:hypothetical protein